MTLRPGCKQESGTLESVAATQSEFPNERNPVNWQTRWFGFTSTRFPRISGGPWFSFTMTVRFGPRKSLI